MTKKYEFTGDVNPHGLRRIRRLSDNNLGGWIEYEKNLSQRGACWVYVDAKVSGYAKVSGDAQVSGDAKVSGDAQVYGNAQVSGNAQVYGDAHIYGHARVSGNARVYGDAKVSGDARVSGDAKVYRNAVVKSPLKMATRSDHYTFSFFPCADKVWRLTAGCRYFTLDEAWKHWVASRDNTPLGEETFDILVLFEHHSERNPIS